MIIWILFSLATIVLAVMTFFVVRLAYRNGHIGDLTMPVSGVLVIVLIVLWLLSVIILINLKADPLMNLKINSLKFTNIEYV